MYSLEKVEGVVRRNNIGLIIVDSMTALIRGSSFKMTSTDNTAIGYDFNDQENIIQCGVLLKFDLYTFIVN